MAAYVTIPDFTLYVQSVEGYIDDGEGDDGIIATVYGNQIQMASDRINSILAVRYTVPVPATQLIKELCCRIAHWKGEKEGDARERVWILYQDAIAQLECIAKGEELLLDAAGAQVGTIGGDSDAEKPGIQSTGTHVGQRGGDWHPLKRSEQIEHRNWQNYHG